MASNKTIIIITGPTAVGKTSLAIQLAKKYNTEIISCDSRQIYKELSIGTAKPTSEELAQVKHHFIDHISIFDPFSTGTYERECDELIYKLFETKDTIIMTGGTGLYIQAVLSGLDEFPDVSPEIREEYDQKLKDHGLSALIDELKEKDLTYYQKVDKQNSRRITRALCVIKQSGQAYSSFIKNKKKELKFDVKYYILNRDRPELYDRINQRVDQMIENGLIEEANLFYEHKNIQALKTVGYNEIFKYLDKEYTLEHAIDKIKQHTRNYAKRQLTWFRKVENGIWLDANDIDINEF